MSSITVKCPLNSLSFGNVSLNLLRELYNKNINVSLFPIGDKSDLSAYDQLEEGFKQWIESSINNRLRTVRAENPLLQLWHINGSEGKISKSNNTLVTFYELDKPTEEEVNLVKLQDHVLFSSRHACDLFKSLGCKNVSHVGMGFDPDFVKSDVRKLEGRTHFILMGKFEKRKHTSKIIQAWAKKFGNKFEYQLTCCIVNPFFNQEQMNQVIAQTLQGQRYGNINFLPYLKTNSEVNDLLNSADIDLTGLSGAEGWNLPAFNATCLGKWSIVLNCTSHKDWATKENCILVEPTGKEPAADGVFFHTPGPFNQGNIYSLDENLLDNAFDLALKKVGSENVNGLELAKKFSYSNTVDKILSTMGV